MKLLKQLKPLKPLVKRAKELVELWQKEFPDYEIETIVADIEVNIPRVAKGMLKVSMKKKEKS